MRPSERKRRKIVIWLLCSVLLLMAIGYAAFASQLNIKGSTNISTSWDVRITNITSKNVVGTASNLEEPSYTNLTAEFYTGLVSPGDSIEYDITVTNNGNIDAILDKITITDSKNPAIIFTTSGLSEGDTLVTSESKVLTVKVEYSNSVTSQPESTESGIEVTLDFSQNDGHTVTPGPTSFSGTVYSRNILDGDELTSTNYINPGDSIEKIKGYTEDYSTLNNANFLKHTIKNGQVESNEVCFIKDGLHCLSGDSGIYETKKSLLLSAFGQSACNDFGSGVNCSDASLSVTAYDYDNGYVFVVADSVDCKVLNGNAFCRNY